jgi:hypothetical protein
MRLILLIFRRSLGRRASAALEFALVMIPFMMLLLFVIELAYDMFTQEVLDSTLYLAARQIQTGNAQNALSGSDFVAKYMTRNLTGLLSPANVYVHVQQVPSGTGQDYYDFTSGGLPSSNRSLNLTGFASGSFCNAGPTEALVISAVYIGPTIIGGLLPNVLSEYYNGAPVHATLSTIGVVSEHFPTAAAQSGSAAACS